MSIRKRLTLVTAAATLGTLATLVAGAPAGAVTAPIVTAAVAQPPSPITGASCPTYAPANTLRGASSGMSVKALCEQAVSRAATPQAARAIRAAFHMLGGAYACGGTARMAPYQFDCSSLVARAYEIGTPGIGAAGGGEAASTQDMVPWGGASLADWLTYVPPGSLRPGDIVTYDTGGATYRHAVMYIGNGLMLHTSHCGDVAHVTNFWGTGTSGYGRFLVARRAIIPGQPQSAGPSTSPSTSPSTTPSVSIKPGSAPAAFPGGTLRTGSTGAAVASLQKSLITAGYELPRIQKGTDGYGRFGYETYDAVALWQSEHKVTTTRGVVTLAMYRSITGWRGQVSTPSSGSSAPTGTLVISAALRRVPSAVKLVQTALNKTEGAGLPVNGRWGSLTQAALVQFRRDYMGARGSAATAAANVNTIKALARAARIRWAY